MLVAAVADVITKAQKAATAETVVVVAEALTQVEQILPEALTAVAPEYQVVLPVQVEQIQAAVAVAVVGPPALYTVQVEQAVQVSWLFVTLIPIQQQQRPAIQSLQ